ncbi:isochorismatase family protein [Pleionea sediminis]|uniref:isochorismatase family protein n=1 Tax=Pleionea sediminis TaxID=2569479 RepID=UPI001185ED18|nr:isochorismatase family protein [Pleionea sediminis]
MNALDFETTAAFDVDAQYSFTEECPNELPVKEGTQIVDGLNKNARIAKYRVGSKDAHSPKAIWIADDKKPMLTPINGENVDVTWNQHAVPGTPGFELIEGLPEPKAYDFFVWKGVELDMHPYGACYHDLSEKLSTGVIEFLKCQKVTSVIIGGLATDYCVKTTALQLAKADFNVIVNLEACRGIAEETVSQAIIEMKDAGIRIINTIDEL